MNNTQKGLTMRSGTRCFLAVAFLLLPARQATAQKTWTGGGGDNNWSTPQNWTPLGTPTNDGTADIILAGGTRLVPNLDTAWGVKSLTFDSSASGFTIGGNALSIGAGGISNQSPFAQTMNVPVVLGANQSWSTGNQSGTYLLAYGPIDTNGRALTITGAGGGFLNGGVSGSGSVTVALTGTASFASYNTNTYSGGTFLNTGRLFIDRDASLGGPGSPVTFNGGQLGTGSAFTIAHDITLGAAGGTIDSSVPQGQYVTISSTIQGPGKLTIAGGNFKFTGVNTYTGGTFVNGSYLVGTTSSLQGNISLNGVSSTVLEFDQGFSGTYASNITGSGGNVFLRGTGIVTLTGNNTYTATTSLYAGVLEVSASGGGLSPASRLTFELNGPQVGGGPVLQIFGGGAFTRSPSQVIWNGPGGFAARDGKLTVNIGGTSGQSTLLPFQNLVFGSPTANSVTEFQNPMFLGNAITSPAPTVEVNAGAGGDYAVLSGVISGGNRLAKTGNGRLVMTGANTYTGPTLVNGGILSVGTLADGGTASPIGQSTNAAANLSFSNGGLLQYTGPPVATDRGFTLDAAGGFEVTQAATDLTLGGVGSGAGRLFKLGAGRLTLTGASTYTGGTIIFAGTLRIGGAADRLPTGGNVTLAGGTLDLNGFSQTVNGLASVGGAGVVTSGAAGTVTLTIGNGGGGSSYSGVIQDGGGPVALAKVGAGTLTLLGASTYTGGTTVADGTLTVNGGATSGASGTGTGPVSVLNGILGGTGRVGGVVTVASGGALRGDSGAGTGALVLDGDTTFRRSSSAAPTLAVQQTVNGTGTVLGSSLVSLSGGAKLNFDVSQGGFAIALTNDSRLNLGQTYTVSLVSGPSGDVSFRRSGVPLSDGFVFSPDDYQVVSGSGTWTFQNVSLSVQGNVLQVSFTPVPEPLAVGLVAAGGLLAARTRRRFL